MQREPEAREIANWKEHPVTRWWFGKMQDEFDRVMPARPLVDLDDPGKTAMYAAYDDGQRAAFRWAVNFEPDREGEEG